MPHRRHYYIFPESSGVYRGKPGLHVKTVIAYSTCTPGLIVTRRLQRKPSYNQWNLTHAGMGLAIVTGTTRRIAYYIAGVLGTVYDWQWDESTHKEQVEQSRIALQETGLYDWVKSVKY
jgi:hypothetical protein